MVRTKNFSDPRDAAQRDPERSRRIDDAKQRAEGEIASYRLAELRKSLGITHVELAELIGKSQSGVSQIEHGEIGLSIEMLRATVGQLGGEVEVTAVFDHRSILLEA